MKPCDFCIEEECKRKHSCDCSNCDKQKLCPKVLHPTIRITTKCTQSCSHCCFECSPNKDDFMSIETARKIKDFLINHNVERINLMGGEFFCHPEWKQIFSILIPDIPKCRLVTNGDWAELENSEEFAKEFLKYKNNLTVTISYDQWHKSKYIFKARDILDEYNIKWKLPTPDQVSEDSIVPIGRSKFVSYNVYSMFSIYCGKPERKYSFLIDENGDIFKCCFGIWEISDIEDIEFPKIFKEFNQKFYKAFIGSCRSCIRTHNNIRGKGHI